MKGNHLISARLLGKQEFWLLAIAAGLVAIHLTLVSRANDGNLASSSFLYWTAVVYLAWSKRENLKLESKATASFAGILLIGLVLFKSAFITDFDPFLRILPLLSALGLALLSSGFKGLKCFWQELLILCFLVPPPSALSELVDISKVTAWFSTAALWYLGYDVSRDGVYILMPTGGIEVYSGCSGIENMLHLLGLSVLFLIIFPTNRSQKVFVPLIALGIAFLVNSLRVALMAVLAAKSGAGAFEYWHKGDGSLLFSMLTVFLFGIFCFVLLKSEPSEELDSAEY